MTIVVGDPSAQNALETALLPGSAKASATAERAPDDAAWLFYTSGTTGLPKGAVLSHRNLIAMAVNCLADICSFRPDDRLLHVAPLSHGSGMYLIPALSRGAENVIDAGGSFDPDRVLRLVADERVTVLPFLAPTMIVRLLEADPAIRVPALRAIVYGGAPIHLQHLRAALQRFGPVLTQLYGQGESPMTISALPAWAHENADDGTLQSAGFVRSGVEVRILDADGAIAPHGEVGEIAVRGDVVMRGYWRNDDANAAAFCDGWLRSGDIGRFDARGHLHILDRRHDMIISGGSNIYPREVEDILTRHPAVSEAIVFGVPDPEWGESVASVIVLREDCTDVDADTLIAFCRITWQLQEAEADRVCRRAPEERIRKGSAPRFTRSVQLSTLKRQIFVGTAQRTMTLTLRSGAKAYGRLTLARVVVASGLRRAFGFVSKSPCPGRWTA